MSNMNLPEHDTTRHKSVLVAVCTYKRPDDLVALLDSMVPALAGQDADLLVVDNDPSASARSIVERHPTRARYILCADPGIAQARNAALAHRAGYEFVAFVDDDETVAPDWLAQLRRGIDDHDADVATGPVISLFPAGTPRWIITGGFIQRDRHPTGTSVDFAATNNVLIRNSALDMLQSPWLDTAFSRSGGSDAELSWRLVRAGARIVWVDSAVVSELMPLARLTPRWVIKRLVRGGNAHGRLLMREVQRAALFRRGMLSSAVGVLCLFRSLATGRGLRSTDVNRVAHGAGLMQASLGSIVHEYSRG